MDVIDGLACLLTVLQEDLVWYLVDLLQLATHFLRSHKEVDAFNLRQLLQLAYLPPRADQDVPLGNRLMVDDGEDVLADEKDLGGWDVSYSEDDIA